MKNGLFKKSWAVGLMVLFIVGGLTSNIGADDIRLTNTRGFVYVDDDAICPGHGSEDAPYCKIRYAIENTTSEDTIIIASGEYFENIVIDKELALDWYGGDINGTDEGIPIINGNNTGCVIEIKASSVEIKRMNITNSGDTDRDAGVYMGTGIEETLIENCEISDCYYGIWAHRRSMGQPTQHEIRTNTIYDITGQGILISFSDGNIISENEITHCGWHGIHLLDCNHNIIEKNTLKYNRNGIVIDVSRENTIYRNTCQSNDRYGFVIISDIKSKVSENNFLDNGEKQALWVHYSFIQTTTWTRNYYGTFRILIYFVPGLVEKQIDIPSVWFELFPSPDWN